MDILNRDHTPRKAEGRPRLTVNDPRVEAQLAGITFERANIGEALRLGNVLRRVTDRGRKRGGFGERRRISKADAARMLASALRALPAHPTPNGLASYRRRGGAEC